MSSEEDAMHQNIKSNNNIANNPNQSFALNTTQSNISHLLNSSGVISNKNFDLSKQNSDVSEIEKYNG